MEQIFRDKTDGSSQNYFSLIRKRKYVYATNFSHKGIHCPYGKTFKIQKAIWDKEFAKMDTKENSMFDCALETLYRTRSLYV